jgi:hypothetical protein
MVHALSAGGRSTGVESYFGGPLIDKLVGWDVGSSGPALRKRDANEQRH